MFQVYFISIILNLFGGLLLLLLSFEPQNKMLLAFRKFFTHKIIQTVFGLAILVTGILKLFIHSDATGVIIIEDLLPALAGIAVGAIVTLDVFAKEEKGNKKIKKLESTVKPGFIAIGIVVMAVSVLHFLYPTAVIL